MLLRVILIVAALILHKGESRASHQISLPNEENHDALELDGKIPPNCASLDSETKKRCVDCYKEGYLYFIPPNSGSNHSCSEDKPLNLHIHYNPGSCEQDKDSNEKPKLNATGIPNIWEYGRFLGCFKYKNITAGSPFIDQNLGTSNSNKRCLSVCDAKGFKYAGVKEGTSCSCTNETLPSDLRDKDDFSCEVIECPGEPTQKCGAKDRIKLYRTRHADENTRVVPAETYKYKGCYSYSHATYNKTCKIIETVTEQECIAHCTAKTKEYRYSRLGGSSGKECTCSQSLPAPTQKLREDCCTMHPDEIKKAQHCKIKNNQTRMKVYDNGLQDYRYHFDEYVIHKCYTEHEIEIISINGTKITLSNTSPSNCHRYCMASGFKFFEFRAKNLSQISKGDCFCADGITNLSKGFETYREECTTHGKTFIAETGLTDVDLNSSLDFVGCFKMNKTTFISTEFQNLRSLIPKRCVMLCDALNYFYSAVELGSDCHCFNNFTNQLNSTLDAIDECNVRCSGDPFQTCGGSGYRMSVYRTTLGRRLDVLKKPTADLNSNDISK